MNSDPILELERIRRAYYLRVTGIHIAFHKDPLCTFEDCHKPGCKEAREVLGIWRP